MAFSEEGRRASAENLLQNMFPRLVFADSE